MLDPAGPSFTASWFRDWFPVWRCRESHGAERLLLENATTLKKRLSEHY
jgi:hypothetical protein